MTYVFEYQFHKVRQNSETFTKHFMLTLDSMLSCTTVYYWQKVQKNQTIPKGACYLYHLGKEYQAGSSCLFQHRCYNRVGSHTFSQCMKQAHWPFRFLLKSKSFSDKQSTLSKSNNIPSKGPTLIKVSRLSHWLSGYGENEASV